MSRLLALAVLFCCVVQDACAQQRATLTVLNRSNQAISELYVSSTRTTEWGDDRLGSATIPVGRSFRVRLTEGCLYDVEVVYQDGRLEDRLRANLCRSPLQVFTAAEARAAPLQPQQTLTIENRTTRPIVGVSTAPATPASPSNTASAWGENLLEAPLAPGARQAVSFRGDCHADLRVSFDNGSQEQRRGLDVCTASAELIVAPGWTTLDETLSPATTSDAITVVNNSGHRIIELFLWPRDAVRGDDRLGTQVIEPGDQATIALDRNGACVFRLRAVLEGAAPDQEQDGIDFCPRRTITVGAP